MKLLAIFLMIPYAWILAEPLPDAQWSFISKYCTDCHDEDMNEGHLNLDIRNVDWQSAKVRKHFGNAFTMLERSKMPPKKKKKQPTVSEKKAFMSWLDKKLVEENPVGGTALRRLNRREYHNTVIKLFGIYGFQLPGSFPQDLNSHGFDTNAKQLVISPSHFEAYAESAIKVADYLFPPDKAAVKKQSWNVKPTDMTISYSSAFPVDGAMRLASRGNKNRNGTWPAKFEAPISGTYKVEIIASAKMSPKETPILDFKAHKSGRGGKERALESFKVTNKNGPQTFKASVKLYKGENILFLYKNAPFAYEKGADFKGEIRRLFTSDPKLAASWAKLGKVPRGGNGWARLKKTMADPKLNVAKFKKGSKELEKVIAAAAKNTVSSGETLVYKFFEEGPNLGIHNVKISGPYELIEDPDDVKQKSIQTRFLKDYKKTSDTALDKFISEYLAMAFRRGVTAEEVKEYIGLVRQEVASGRRIEDGLHLAIRTSLISPKFLYRENGNGKLSQSELASRLSYFLTSSAPDTTLAKGNLNDSAALRKQCERLISSKGIDTFIHDFTSQWLDTDALDTLMPDPKLFKKFKSTHRDAMKKEVETTFREILKQNMSVREFIDPDFIYTDSSIGKEIYKLKKIPKGKKGTLPKVSITRGTKQGGILSMPAVMMATANGVDTQPVLRGVWILENVLGTPPPEPPKDVPALPPDTSAAKGPRAKLAAHMKSDSCRSCHEDIDPMGFVLENFDPVGRWRDVYPSKAKGKKMKIDASATMPNGTKLNDVRDLKKFLVDNPVYFTGCLSRKLMEYATGRELNYREQKIIHAIVEKNIKSGNKFKDLLLDLIDSQVFRAR